MARFELSELQANAILDMQLRRLAALERQKLQDEYNEVLQRIAYLEDLLASPPKILAVIREDINDVAETYGDTALKVALENQVADETNHKQMVERMLSGWPE